MVRRNRWRITIGLLSVCCVMFLVTAPAWAQAPFKTGFVIPLTGVYAALGEDLRDGFLLYWSQVGSKTAGRTVEVLV